MVRATATDAGADAKGEGLMAERYVAIDNVCAWPNVTTLDDGTLAVAIYNRPVHGRWHGDVEVWGSQDGRLWGQRGTAAAGEPPGNRMNVAAGKAGDGHLVVIASGWTPVLPPGASQDGFEFAVRSVLPPRVCRSADGGRTWERADSVRAPRGDEWFIPFGDVTPGPAGLAVPFYSARPATSRAANTAWFFRSSDEGRTWGDASVIAADDYNETDILHLDAGRWLAACRTLGDGHVELFASDDDGRGWERRGPLTLPRQHPPHLTRLADGRILLTFGIRNEGLYGIGARFSHDDGVTWGAPRLLVALDDASDGGYPSSAQLPDGTIATAYYANRVAAHRRYHMGVALWSASG